ncbi:hypothetical protein [Haloechinothrix salitolerans]|uniref:Uncharacterized protein n=1 Tax=Haloechinothrix salitolerans TaxID=926830 RepID=A0ABW2C458_9PSEU
MTELRVADAAERENLAAFVARAVRLDGQAVVRLRQRETVSGVLDAWTMTPFDVLATRGVRGKIEPRDVTVSGNELLAALTVAGGELMDPGPSRDLLWRSDLPTSGAWQHVDDLPTSVVTEVTERGVEVARDNVGPQGTPPASLLDQPVLTVSNDDFDLKVQLRCLFALSGMGFTGVSGDGPEEGSAEGAAESYGEGSSGTSAATGGGSAGEVVRVSATDSWLRMDARYGAVLRRRHALLPLVF